MKNIVLVGFMGTGKTVVARRLAKRLKVKYISVDEMIVEREGKPIKDIFAQRGEGRFRKVESQVVREVAGMKGVVVDAGGGVVLNEENVKRLKSTGTLVCLLARPEVILDRTKKHAHRPLLNVPDPMAKIKELLEIRAPHYAKADYHIDTSDKSIDEVVEEVAGKI